MRKIYFRVSLSGQQWQRGRARSTRRIVTFYLSSVSFAAGDGMRINRFTYTLDKAKAYQFSKFTAEAVARQLSDGSFGRKYRDVKVEQDV